MTEYELVKDMVPFSGDLDTYRLLRDAYTGGGGFETGRYLAPHPREPMEKYERRCFMSYYCNYVKPCVDAHVNPIFKEYPVREYKASRLMDAFLNDVDGKATKMDRFMKRVALQAKLFGSVFGVMDNVTAPAENLDEALKTRRFPYLYLVKPEQVEEVRTDKFGNLVYFKYSLEQYDAKGEGKTKAVTWTWTGEMWRKATGGEVSEGVNEIGVIPVIPLMGALKDDGDLKPLSEFYSIARANLAIFNACSELRERNRNQAFSVLTYQLGEDNDYNQAQEIVIGATDMLMYPGTAPNRPEYVTPSLEPSRMLLDEIKMIVEEIYRMTERANVTGVQKQASGLAKEWDNQSIHQTIAEFAKNLEEFEEKAAYIFGLYVGEDLQYNAKYNDEFGVVDADAALDQAAKSLSLAIGGKFDREVKKQTARTVLRDLDDHIIREVLEDIGRQGDDAAHVKAEGLGGDV